MVAHNAQYLTEGTAAVKVVNRRSRARIIEFPTASMQALPHSVEHCRRNDCRNRVAASSLAKSELICSLLFEDARGCSYRAFTRAQSVGLGLALFAAGLATVLIGL